MNWIRTSLGVSSGVTVQEFSEQYLHKVIHGEELADPAKLLFRDPNAFRAGELHKHHGRWCKIVGDNPSSEQATILRWICDGVSIFEFFQSFSGSFKGRHYQSDRPPSEYLRNSPSCKPFADFVKKTLLERLRTGAISLKGRISEVELPHLVLPLTVEPTKPRLCHDARFLNLWMMDVPFKLDSITNLPRYVAQNTYQTILDDKSGYDHLFLTEQSRVFFGIQWGGWIFLYNTLPFGWKISPSIYHSTGLMASNFFRSIGIPCSLYIDDRHIGQLQVSLDQGPYRSLKTVEERNLAAAKSAIFLVAYYLIDLGYFLGLSKSILTPQQVVPYLGFLSDSVRMVFHLIAENKGKFLNLIRETLSCRVVKTLQRLAGKCVSFSLVVPGALLFTREMNCAISKGMRTNKPIRLLRRKLPTGCSWKIGMTLYRGGMNAIFAYPLQLMPPAQAGVESCYHHPQQVSQITGRRRKKAMISTQEKQSL